MWVRAPNQARKFRKWSNDMLGNADVSKPRATFHVKRRRRRNAKKAKKED